MVVVLAVALGTVNAVDSPTRQTFVPEVAGPQLLRNAVSLNSVMTSAARAIGPALAGILIAAVGVGVCFLANAASFAAVLLAYTWVRTDQLLPIPAVERGPVQLTAGLRYVRGTAGLWAPLTTVALIGTLAYEFQVVLPLLARTGMRGDARTYDFMASAMGAGAVLGGLAVASYGRARVVPLVGAAAGFGAAWRRLRPSPGCPWSWRPWPAWVSAARCSWRPATRRCSWSAIRVSGAGSWRCGRLPSGRCAGRRPHRRRRYPASRSTRRALPGRRGLPGRRRPRPARSAPRPGTAPLPGTPSRTRTASARRD